MAIDNPSAIDFVIAEDRSTAAIRVISDHLNWTSTTCEPTPNDMEHAYALQEKLNSYLQFVEGGQLVDEFPKSIGKPVLFLVSSKYPLNEWATEFYASYDP